jgi:hypothetical protein
VRLFGVPILEYVLSHQSLSKIINVGNDCTIVISSANCAPTGYPVINILLNPVLIQLSQVLCHLHHCAIMAVSVHCASLRVSCHCYEKLDWFFRRVRMEDQYESGGILRYAQFVRNAYIAVRFFSFLIPSLTFTRFSATLQRIPPHQSYISII